MSQLVPGISTFSNKDDYCFATMYSDSSYNGKKLLDGLNCGVPTRTTPTLTPTTLRNIEQTFIELQCQSESHQNQAGFEPPLLKPLTTQGNGLLMSLVDTRSWQGGSTVVGEPSALPTETLRNITPSNTNTTTAPTRRNMGGRRPNRDKSISPEEEERRQIRRERNKLAAARCRKRRLDHTNELLEETECLEEKKQSLQSEIQTLQMQKEELEFLLEAHKSCCRLGDPQSPPDVKPFSSESSEKVLLGGIPVTVKQEPSNSMPAPKKPAEGGTRPRPNSLPVSAYVRKPVTTVPASEVGIPITTPTSGIPFNFESLMEGGTGLTPVSGPIVPSCSSQQRNSSCVDLSSPDSVPTKLVSL
ncbi:transcription factor kayak isoform X2 [Lycorma delicatula]|uniref:transcription factor kayak isoform X2 n=1 Tax=Lycorma delicatula TaxID=130591 RepID=UPI003F50DD2B